MITTMISFLCTSLAVHHRGAGSGIIIIIIIKNEKIIVTLHVKKRYRGT